LRVEKSISVTLTILVPMTSTFNSQATMASGAAFPHEKLDTWRMAKELAVSIYRLTAPHPNEERFGLVNQLRRAAVSVMSNLAEGSGRASYRDQAHFSQLT